MVHGVPNSWKWLNGWTATIKSFIFLKSESATSVNLPSSTLNFHPDTSELNLTLMNENCLGDTKVIKISYIVVWIEPGYFMHFVPLSEMNLSGVNLPLVHRLPSAKCFFHHHSTVCYHAFSCSATACSFQQTISIEVSCHLIIPYCLKRYTGMSQQKTSWCSLMWFSKSILSVRDWMQNYEAWQWEFMKVK